MGHTETQVNASDELDVINEFPAREQPMKLWSVYVIANERASVVSRKWVAARDEAEARTMATKDSRSETGRVLLIKPHHSDSVSVTDQWSVSDIKAIAEELSEYLPGTSAAT
ncbi:hypothetical protein [Corallococcus interemptor]|uniref:hypothetical protein n=1 Tax=Corallococcus interemptor TaxID=2316720 RepID=UPI0011C3CF60|nr:hypothetical protein [Corallococcus interemptor]